MINLVTLNASLAAANNAIAPFETLVSDFGPFAPAPLVMAVAELKLAQTVLPTLITDIETAVADAEAAWAKAKAAATPVTK